MRVAFHTLGCKVNQYETEAIKEAFVSHGAEIVSGDEPADIYIVNTCTVTNIADRKSRQYIRRMKSVCPDALMIVTGCYAQVSPDDVAAMPEVDLVIGNNQKSKICELAMERLEEAAGATAAGKAADVMVIPRDGLTFYEDMGRVSSSAEGMVRAYVKIQDGCDRFCTYCLIPYARGPVRSRPAAEIVEEVRSLVGAGFREVILTGINTALYGTEDGAECSLSELLTMLDGLETDTDFRVRLSSLEPTVVDRDHVEEIIRHKRLCHHLHLSVQNGSDSVLRAMNRHYTREEYLDIVRMLREYDPLFGITTDIIVGFPGETDEDFRQTLDLVREAGFGKVHVFRYSPRKGTVGAGLPDAVPGDVKNRRADELERAASEAAKSFLEKNTGVVHKVLVEEISGGIAEGYTDNYIKTRIDCGPAAVRPGSFCEAVLTETDGEGCTAVPAEGH